MARPRPLRRVGDVAGSLGHVFPMDKGYFVWGLLPLVSLIFLLEITASIREKDMKEADALWLNRSISVSNSWEFNPKHFILIKTMSLLTMLNSGQLEISE